MPERKLPDRYRQNPEVAWRTLEGRSVLVNLDTQKTLLLNEVGSRAWEIFEETHTIDEVAGEIETEFNAPAEIIRRDVMEFTAQLVEKGLLIKDAGNKK